MRRIRIRNLRPGRLDLAAYSVGAAIVTVLSASAVRASMRVTVSPTAVSAETAAVVFGLAVVAALWAGISSGVRGGPLALAGPTVHLVMLAPVDRRVVLQWSALRQLFLASAGGAFLGGVAWVGAAGEIAGGRGSPLPWTLAGAVVALAGSGVALVGAGLRMSNPTAVIARLALVVWWVADLALATTTSPVAVLAHMPFGSPTAVEVFYVAVAFGIAALGVRQIGGLSLERAWRRHAAADRLRTAIGLNDLRTAVLILRRRSAEAPRARPWHTFTGPWTRHHPIPTRSVRALMRWPTGRLLRLVAAAAAAGALTVIAPHHPVVILLIAALVYAGALDAVDALAQELDHPDLQRGYPMPEAVLAVRHIPVPLLVMVAFNLIAAASGALVGDPRILLTGALASPLLALAAIAGAVMTATRTARPLTRIGDIGLPPEVVAPRILLRVAAPVLPLVATLLPFLTAPPDGGPAVVLLALPGGLVSLGLLVALVQRERLERLAVWAVSIPNRLIRT